MPDPWQLAVGAFRDVKPEGRFDDPEGRSPVLYASSTRLGCFVETLARFRKAPASVMAALCEIEHTDEGQPAFGTVPAGWLLTRLMGSARVKEKRCADIYSSEWLSYLRRAMEADPKSFGIAEIQFDLSDLMSRNRRASQRASSLVRALGDFGGIYYQSRHGSDLSNWALFEPFECEGTGSELHSDDSDFKIALGLLDLALDPVT